MNDIYLTEYQEDVIYELVTDSSKKGKILWWDMGSGKTIATLAFINNFSNFECIVILPQAIQYVWINEGKKAGVSTKNIKFYNYESIYKFFENETNLKNKILVLDEAHNFFPNVSKFKIKMSTVFKLTETSEKILALSGTPVMSEMSEISPLVNLVAGYEHIPFNKYDFDQKFFKVNKKRSLIIGWLLPILTFPLVLNTIVIVAADSPGFIGAYVIFWFLSLIIRVKNRNMKDFEGAKFIGEVKDYIHHYKPEQDIKSKENYPEIILIKKEIFYDSYQTNILTELSYNVCTKENFKKIDIEDENEIMYFSEKLDKIKFIQKASLIGNLSDSGNFSNKIMDMVEIAEGKRAVFYSKSYSSGSKILMEYLDRINIPYLYLDKNIPIEKINEILHKFKTKTIFLVLNPIYIEGISIIGAEQLHIMEPPDNYAIRSQLIGRVKRLFSHAHLPESERRVLVYEWLCVREKISVGAMGSFMRSMVSNFKVWIKYKREVFYLNQLPDPDVHDANTSPDEMLYSNNIGIQKISEGISNKVYNNKKCCIKYLSKSQENDCMKKIGVRCNGGKFSKKSRMSRKSKKSRKSRMSKKSKKNYSKE